MKKETMSTKNAKHYEKLTQQTLLKIAKFDKLQKQINTLNNKKTVLAKELIKEILKDKKVKKNEYLEVGKFFVGIAQSKAPFSVSKSDLESKLIELGVDIEPMKKYGKEPEAVLKVESTGKK